jgi:hypothetical protein
MLWSALAVVLLGSPAAVMAGATAPGAGCNGTLLFNGICSQPRVRHIRPPGPGPSMPDYLADPPAVINISRGRQLFVDPFLIENSSGVRLTIGGARGARTCSRSQSLSLFHAPLFIFCR